MGKRQHFHFFSKLIPKWNKSVKQELILNNTISVYENLSIFLSLAFCLYLWVHLRAVTLMAFLTRDSNPFKRQRFHDFLHFWCNFLPIITLFVLLFIRQCTSNGNIRPRLAFHWTKTKFNLMCLAVRHHCWRHAIKTILSVFILVLEAGHVEALW